MTKRLAFMLAVALGACAGSGTGRVQYAAVTVRSPELVTVEPNVYVLADADEPVFYTDNYYWLYRDNGWYRSHSYDRDWVRVSRPSARLRSINSPTAYVRYQTRRHEARNQPMQRDVLRDDRERTDVPNNVPLQPTEPERAPRPYPMPPQQKSPIEDANHPREQIHNDVRVPDDGSYERAPGAPAPGQLQRDENQIKRDDKAEKKQEHQDEKAQKKEQKKEDKKDKKQDY